jgi:hypothetical protein
MSAVSTNQPEQAVVHVNGPRPTARQLAREVSEVALALPLFATAPLLRHWHRRWGATDAEVAAAMPGDEANPGRSVAFALGPDLAVLYGIAPGLARGQLHPRCVPLHNALHRFWGPLGMVIVVVTAGLPRAWLAAALAWGFHVAFDRAIGLRLRSSDGFQRGERS